MSSRLPHPIPPLPPRFPWYRELQDCELSKDLFVFIVSITLLSSVCSPPAHTHLSDSSWITVFAFYASLLLLFYEIRPSVLSFFSLLLFFFFFFFAKFGALNRTASCLFVVVVVLFFLTDDFGSFRCVLRL